MTSPTWTGEADYPTAQKISLFGWLRVALRGSLIAAVLVLGIVTLTLIRLIEKPIFGLRRPVGGYVPALVCRISLFLMGIRFHTSGTPMRGGGAAVANHSSWLDIFTLNAKNPVFFVSKSEVARWPGIGFLAKIAGTVFIARDRKEAQAQKDLFENNLAAGQKLLFFPEGTSTDSLRVLPFKPTLFAAFFAESLRESIQVQPVTVNYHAPEGADPRFYGWWGDMEFGAHLLQMLAARSHGRVEVIYHPPLSVRDFQNRKALAAAAESQVRAGHFRTQ
ncbi:lysophospholipid acyltransferase family protein [Cognatishimia maritima]|uniref:Lyso-ornithine lipid acyltransferase n=1 Tax=Cognatishimia maritima TaxID=870908 RepID=A0A1M5IH12_9RHOB|nr:lysophospholipid acyltransferase family protein [Cognatishimia maritima]SHG27541.1 lyso-ornithine lipid acyltransferase [Cognatishimia maritima]